MSDHVRKFLDRVQSYADANGGKVESADQPVLLSMMQAVMAKLKALDSVGMKGTTTGSVVSEYNASMRECIEDAMMLDPSATAPSDVHLHTFDDFIFVCGLIVGGCVIGCVIAGMLVFLYGTLFHVF